MYSYIGPMAQVENEDLPEEEMSSLEEIALMNKRWGLVLKAPESAEDENFLGRTWLRSWKMD